MGESSERAHAVALESQERFFPAGQPLPGQHPFAVFDNDTRVGWLWIGERTDTGPEHWWVWDIEIDPEFRGRGLGRATMLRAEIEARDRGALSLGLNVFGFNAPARSLYESLGYETTAVQMRKDFSETTPGEENPPRPA